MRYVLILGIILQMLLYTYDNQEENEPFYIFKCMIYLFISSIHSIIIIIKLPLGACLMSIIYLLDKKNHHVKLRLICSGLLIVILSALTYKDISILFEKLYLYKNINKNIKSIEVYTHNGVTNKYLFSIDNRNDIKKWYSNLKTSTPHSAWNYKIIPKNAGYLIKLKYSSKTIPIIINSPTSNLPNMFIGQNYIPYTNRVLADLIDSYLTIKPISLKIISNDAEITNTNIISDLWNEILWNEQLTAFNNDTSSFQIESILSLTLNHKVTLNFSNDFTYLKLNNSIVLKLSEYLSNKLNEQYILSQLDNVKTLTQYAPAHIHTSPQNTANFSIETDNTGIYYGLYSNNGVDNKKILLHKVSSSNSKFFVLKNPYILLLDEKHPSQYYLMLINQNLSNKHRYIEKSKNIIPSSIALCPHNTRFTYTINNYGTSSLYLVNNYYNPPVAIASGNILDSLFLSDKYLAFSLIVDNVNLLCIYDIDLSKTIKYITIPGNVHLMKVENNNIIFSIQQKSNGSLKEGIFALDPSLSLKRLTTK